MTEPRGLYHGHPKTEELVAQAHRRVNEVVSPTTIPVKVSYADQDQVRSQQGYDTSSWVQGDNSPTNAKYLSTPQDLANGRLVDYDSPSMSFDASQAPPQRASNYELTDGPRKQSIDDFGMPTWGSSGAGASRFNTYPPKIGPSGDGEGSYQPNHEPTYLPTRRESNSSSASITKALVTVGDRPRENANVHISRGSTAPPSYVEPELDSQYEDVSRFSGHFSGTEEENGLVTYIGGAHEQEVSSHQGQTQNEFPVATGRYRSYAESEDVDYANQPTGTQEDFPERVSQHYPALDIGTKIKTFPSRCYDIKARTGHSPRNRTTFEFRNQHAPGSEEEERELFAAAAREIGREMEAMNVTRNRRNRLPRSVHSTVTDDFNTNLPPPGDVLVPMTIAESTLPPPPLVPFARPTISLRPSSSQPHTNQLYRSPIQPRQNLPPSYETPDLSLPSPTRLSFLTNPLSPQISSRSPFSLSQDIRTCQPQ